MTPALTYREARPMTTLQRTPPGAAAHDPLAYWTEQGRQAAESGLSRADAVWCSEPMRMDRRAAYMKGFDEARRISPPPAPDPEKAGAGLTRTREP